MSTPKAVLFDAGGTLVTMDPSRLGDLVEPILNERPDPGRMVAAHYQAMAAIGENLQLLEAGDGMWWPWWISQFLQLAGMAPNPEAVDRLVSSHGLWRSALPEAISGVEAIKGGGYQVAVVSNADGHVRDDLEAAGFGHLFDVVIDSTAVGVSKPDPAIFDHALRALGVDAADAWYVGDSTVFDLGGAEAAGLAEFVLVDPFDLHPSYEPRVEHLGQLMHLLE